MIRLYTLGTTRLLAERGRTFDRLLAQPKGLALLSYLAVASPGAFQRRDNLLALFWPDRDEKHARWALNQTVRRLRSELGSHVVASRGATGITVNPDVLWSDAVAFQEACASKDWSGALQLYRGEFLDGLHVAGCVEVAQWLDTERARLRQLAAHATWSLVDLLEARGALPEAVERAREGLQLAPEMEQGARRLIALLDASGDRAGAVHVYEEYATWLLESLQVQPAPETVAAIEAVKSRARATPESGSSPPGGAAGQVLDAFADGGTERTHVRRNGRSWLEVAAAALGTIVLLTITNMWAGRDSGSPHQLASAAVVPAIRSIAVLPLNNGTGDREQEYFVEGMHEALIAELSKIGALKVISRTSTIPYRQTDKPLRQVARELGVDAVIEGSVLREGERVRITVDLVHGATGHLWAQTFERELRSLPALQRDLARAIADESRVSLTPREQRALASAHVLDPEAHQVYLKGRYHLGKGTLEGLRNARDSFRQSLDLNPTYAPAYVGLADVYNRLAIHGRELPREVYPLAKAALVKALELDRDFADAHALRGVVRFRFDWDWEGAERDLKRALELEPNNTRALLGYSTYLLMTGRPEEALAYSAKFQDRDPLSPFASRNLAWHLYHNRRYQESVSRLRVALHLDPGSGAAYYLLGQSYAAMEAYGEAIAACDTANDLAPNDSEVLSTCGAVYAASGKHPAAVRSFQNLQVLSSAHGYVDPYHLASLAAAIHSSRTGSDRILELLARAYEDRSANLCSLKLNPAFRGMSGDPRFQELLRRMDFPERVRP